MFIYKITNTVNGKCYIGQTCQKLSYRYSDHIWRLKNDCHTNLHLQRSWNKHTKHAFKFELITEGTSKEELNLLEIAWIAELNSADMNFGYNKEFGGNKYKTCNEETRIKLSFAAKGRTASDETRRKLSESKRGDKNPFFGKSLSVEHRRNVGLAGVGRNHSIESKMKMSKARSGIPLTPEHCEKLSKSHLGQIAWNRKQIKCITTGEIFESATHAAKILKLSQSSVSAVCRGLRTNTKGFSFKLVG